MTSPDINIWAAFCAESVNSTVRDAVYSSPSEIMILLSLGTLLSKVILAFTGRLSLSDSSRNFAETSFSPSSSVRLTTNCVAYGIHWKVLLSETMSPSIYISSASSADIVKLTERKVVAACPEFIISCPFWGGILSRIITSEVSVTSLSKISDSVTSIR